MISLLPSQENFSSLDEYIIYEYISKSTPLPAPRGPSSEAGQSRFSITFSELPGRVDERYCLIYFSQTEDSVQSVLGISEAFSLKEKRND